MFVVFIVGKCWRGFVHIKYFSQMFLESFVCSDCVKCPISKSQRGKFPLPMRVAGR